MMAQPSPCIVVIGSCNVDLVSYTPRLPKPGETIHGSRFSMGFGGKAANQCVQAARIGARASMIAKVGVDHFGQDYLENFHKNHVDCEHVAQTSQASTGVAPITVDESGQNSIIIVSGANLLLSKDDVERAESLISSATVLVAGFEANLDASLLALKIANDNDVTTILNAAPALPDADPDFYKATKILCVNETEAEILTGFTVDIDGDEDAKGGEGKARSDTSQQALSALLGMGSKIVIITLGAKGAVFAAKDKPTKEFVPAKNLQPIDTTGAGDSFVGALAYFQAYFPKLPLRDQIARSCEIASMSVLKEGTQSSYPYRRDLHPDLFVD